MPKPGARGPKREQVSNACTSCRISKLKCSGRHPACYRCISKDLECVYDVSEGMTKRQHLNHELFEQKHELERALAVLQVLQFGSDQEATASLARLRLGSSVEQEYHRLLAQVPQPGMLSADSMPQSQLPTPAIENPEDPTPWGYPVGGCVDWNRIGTDPMGWTNPMSPTSQPSSAKANSSSESPHLDITAATPGSNDTSDGQHSCLGG